LDNSDGIADFVAAGFDRWDWWQLDPLVVTGGFGGANPSTGHGPARRCLVLQVLVVSRWSARDIQEGEQRGK
jgi:hypothetical protein